MVILGGFLAGRFSSYPFLFTVGVLTALPIIRHLLGPAIPQMNQREQLIVLPAVIALVGISFAPGFIAKPAGYLLVAIVIAVALRHDCRVFMAARGDSPAGSGETE